MGKHVQVNQLKTIGNQSLVAQEGESSHLEFTVPTDNKTISLNSEGAVQLGVLNDEHSELIIDTMNTPIAFQYGADGRKTLLSGEMISMFHDEGSYWMTMTVYEQHYAAPGSMLRILPHHISMTSGGDPAFVTEINPGNINLSQVEESENGLIHKLVTVSPTGIVATSMDTKHTFNYPTNTIDKSSTMVVSVNGKEADTQGNIDITDTVFQSIKLKTPDGRVVELAVENDLTITTKEIV